MHDINEFELYKRQILSSWNALPYEQRVNIDPEVFAENWLRTNVNNLSNNTLTTIIGIIGGAIASSILG